MQIVKQVSDLLAMVYITAFIMAIVYEVISRDKGEAGFLHPGTNMWNTVIFPRHFPDSREDVKILEGCAWRYALFNLHIYLTSSNGNRMDAEQYGRFIPI